MAKKLGNDYRIWIKGEGETYAVIKGNQELRRSRAGSTVDTTTKDDFPYGTAGPGTKTLTVSASFIPDLPDANGFERLEQIATANTSTTAHIQIRSGGPAGADPENVVLECEMYVTSADDDMSQNSAVTASYTFTAAKAPTVDRLG